MNMSPRRSHWILAAVDFALVTIAGSAGAVGANGIYIPWVESFCGGETMILEAQVCNETALEQTYGVEFSDHGPFSGCDVSVVPEHSFVTDLPLVIAPGACSIVEIEITKPGELLAHDQVCYWLRFLLDGGASVTLGGYLTDNAEYCFDWWIAEPVVFLHPMTPVIMEFIARGIQPTPFRFPYLVGAYADFDWVDQDLVSIDGMPPGEFAFGVVDSPDGDAVVVQHGLEWRLDEPSRYIDLVVLREDDLSPLASIGLHQVIAAPIGVGEGAATDSGSNRVSLRVSPNPSRGPTAILWESTGDAANRLEIFDAVGRHVRALEVSARGAGPQRTTWDGRDDAGVSVPPGVYWVRLPHAAELPSKLLLVR